MFKFLTSKKGFTIVELLIVLVLLGLGVFAIGNIVKVSYKSFDKSEERYVKQEAVKTVAEILRSGSNSVSAAQTADIFPSADIVPAGATVDESYSYLFYEPHENEDGEIDGYFLYIQDKGKTRDNAIQLSEIPMYVSIDAYIDYSYEGAPEMENQCGVIVTLAALEDSYEYVDSDNDGKIDPPKSDDIYYSLDVAYHFPNMVTNDNGVKVNFIKKAERSTADLYDQSTGQFQKENGKNKYVSSVDKNGVCLRVYCDSLLSGDPTNTNVSVPKLCFVATASYGYDSAEVGMLCEFRDKCLLTNPVGTAFVKAYYKISPPIADFIAEREGLRAAVRFALKPLVVVAEYCLNEDIAGIGMGYFAVFMMCGFGITVTLVRVNKRNRIEKHKMKS